jgi:hypothetical protein
MDTDGTHWSSGNTGSYSIAVGRDTKAKGMGSTALGYETSAEERYSTAIGYQSTASQWYATAIGGSNVASGAFSFALGSSDTASGDGSFVAGFSSKAWGPSSMALGKWLIAGPASQTFVMGSGAAPNDRLVNNVENSLMVGFGTSTPTLFVGGLDNRVGIATASPEEKLDVAGTAQVTGLKMPTGAVDGYVMMTDASGVGTWQPPSAVGDNDWVVAGDTMYSAVAGNVGIGTALPSAKLDVDGDINADSLYKIGGSTVLSTKGTRNVMVGAEAGANNAGAYNAFTGYRAGYHNDANYGTFLGYSAGYNNEGNENTFVGYWAGYFNSTGIENTFIGKDAGRNNNTGYANTCVGEGAGYSSTTGHYNTFIGRGAGGDNTSGNNNTFLGAQAGNLNVDGYGNTMLGVRAGDFNTSGYYNTFVGKDAAARNTEGHSNTFVGTYAGFETTTGDSNTFIGLRAGANNTIGSRNVFVGNQAGYNETGSGKLYIANGQNTDDVLIYGDFATGEIGMGTLTPGCELDVVGTVQMTGFSMPTGAANGYVLTSDASGAGSWQPQVEGLPTGAYGQTLHHDGADWVADAYLYCNGSSVGIGTSSPSDQLEVAGEVDITSTNSTTALNVHSSGFNSGRLVNLESTQDVGLSQDMLQIKMTTASNDGAQFIECERGYDVEFRVDGDGNVYADGSFTGPADFSEMIAVSAGAASMEPGDIAIIDPSRRRSIVKATEPRSTLVAGIYSTRPGFVGSERDWDSPAAGEGEERSTHSFAYMASEFDEIPLAVVGIVPCKVSVENGPISPGDLLVTSSTPGHAMRDENPATGTVVAKALEPFTSGTGVIRVLVTLQ